MTLPIHVKHVSVDGYTLLDNELFSDEELKQMGLWDSADDSPRDLPKRPRQLMANLLNLMPDAHICINTDISRTYPHYKGYSLLEVKSVTETGTILGILCGQIERIFGVTTVLSTIYTTHEKDRLNCEALGYVADMRGKIIEILENGFDAVATAEIESLLPQSKD